MSHTAQPGLDGIFESVPEVISGEEEGDVEQVVEDVVTSSEDESSGMGEACSMMLIASATSICNLVEPNPPGVSSAAKAAYIFGPISGLVGPGGNCRGDKAWAR